MNWWTNITPGQATLASTGANILAGAFGGGGNNVKGEEVKRAYRLANKNIGDQLVATVKGAKAAGIHPLFAMGASQGYSPVIPGQSEKGSVAKNALASVGQGFEQYALLTAKADLIDKMNENERLGRADHETSNDTKFFVAQGVEDARAQEFKKGEVQAHNPDNREQNKNVISPMTKMRLGSQDIWIPMEEMESFMEDPLAPSVAVLTYHGNKNVDWNTVRQDWTQGGWKNLKPADATRGTKQMLMRLMREKRKKLRQKHGYKPSSLGRPQPRPLSRR